MKTVFSCLLRATAAALRYTSVSMVVTIGVPRYARTTTATHGVSCSAMVPIAATAAVLASPGF